MTKHLVSDHRLCSPGIFLTWRAAALAGLLLGAGHHAHAQEVLTPSNVFMNAYHAPRLDDAAVPQTRANAFTVLTDGIIDRGSVNRIDTWKSDHLGIVMDFVGLEYETPSRFDFIQIELGFQFGDGGDWQSQPHVYILKDRTLVGDTVEPQLASNWVQLPSASVVETAGHVFSPIVVPGSPAEGAGTIRFDLTGIPADDRVGWGWAVGGVSGNHRASDQLFNFISLTEVWAEGESGMPAPPIPPHSPTPDPINVVSNVYNSVGRNGDFIAEGWRGQAFASVTNGLLDRDVGLGHDGFDTWQGDAEGVLTDFVGLQYRGLYRFDTLTIELGNQFGDGGDWQSTPRIFILKNPVDTNQTRPEEDPANWTEVFGADETAGHVFSPIVSPGPGGTIHFDLTAIPAEERTGWGWAVGGVPGNHRETDMVWNFISVTELSATGVFIPEPNSLAVLMIGIGFSGLLRRRNVAGNRLYF